MKSRWIYCSSSASTPATVAKRYRVIAIPILGELFRQDPALADLELAQEMDWQPPIDSEALRLGLCLCREFGILAPAVWSKDNLEVLSFGVSKFVVTMEDP